MSGEHLVTGKTVQQEIETLRTINYSTALPPKFSWGTRCGERTCQRWKRSRAALCHALGFGTENIAVSIFRCTPLLAKCHTAMRRFQNVSKLRNSEFIWINTVVVKDRVGIGKQVLWSLTDKALKEFTWKIPAPINEPEAKMFTRKTTYLAPWHGYWWANSLILGVCVGRRSKWSYNSTASNRTCQKHPDFHLP